MTLSKKKHVHRPPRLSDPNWQREQAERLERRRTDPLSDSVLEYWLGLEAWHIDEGLLILCGVEPEHVEWSYTDEGNEGWRYARPFFDPLFTFETEDPNEINAGFFLGDGELYREYLDSQIQRQEILSGYYEKHSNLSHRLSHSPSALGEPIALPGVGGRSVRYSPVQYIGWALRISAEPPWYMWAQENGLLPDQINPAFEPYLDPDGEDYPELLAIAIRAWDFARKAEDGSPKQIISNFLQERYPQISTNSRDAIALVANWEKRGGRPKKNR